MKQVGGGIYYKHRQHKQVVVRVHTPNMEANAAMSYKRTVLVVCKRRVTACVVNPNRKKSILLLVINHTRAGSYTQFARCKTKHALAYILYYGMKMLRRSQFTSFLPTTFPRARRH